MLLIDNDIVEKEGENDIFVGLGSSSQEMVTAQMGEVRRVGPSA